MGTVGESIATQFKQANADLIAAVEGMGDAQWRARSQNEQWPEWAAPGILSSRAQRGISPSRSDSGDEIPRCARDDKIPFSRRLSSFALLPLPLRALCGESLSVLRGNPVAHQERPRLEGVPQRQPALGQQ